MLGDMLGDIVLMVVGVIGIGGGIITLVGAALLAVGIVRGRNVENFDELAPKIMKVVGVILLVVGMIVLCFDGVGGVAYVTENYGYVNPLPVPVTPTVTQINYLPLQYQWNPSTDVDEAAETAIQRLLTFSYSYNSTPADQDLLEELFTEVVRRDSAFSSEVETYLNQVPEGLSYENLVADNLAGGQGASDNGIRLRTGHKTWRCEADGETWFLTVKYCYESNLNERVGITQFIIEDMESRAAHKEEDYPEYIAVYKDTPADGEHAALIWGEAFLLKDNDDPATAEELKSYIDGGATTLEKLKEKMGEPDGMEKRSDKNSTDYYYELKPENGEALYAWVEVIDGENDLFEVNLLTATEYLEDRTIYQKNADPQN